MNPFFILWLMIYELIALVLAAFGAPIVCLFARWDKDVTTFTGGASDNGPPTIRGDLPRWAWPWETIDERLPGGMYEETVRKVHRRFGRYWCSVYWLMRNRMMGLSAALYGGPPSPRSNRFYWRRIGPLYFGFGYKKYRATPQAHWVTGPFIEMPSVTIRLKRT